MDELLRYFEEELGLFGQYAREFRSRFPKPAGELHIAGESYEDPSVARLIQSVALLSARIHKRLDDDHPKFTESLLESLYPHYLRPLPSYSVARIVQSGRDAGEFAAIARGTPLRSSPVGGTACQFRTVYPVLTGPLQIVRAAFAVPFALPAGTSRAAGLPRGVTAGVAICLEWKGALSALCRQGMGRLRVFVDGEPSLRAALIDALFMRARAAWVEAGDGKPWLALDTIPLGLAGLEEDEALLPAPARSHPAFRLLTEYFTYPEKFNFIDIDLGALAGRLPPGCERCTLHVGLAGMSGDCDAARVLAPLAARHLLLGCTPVVNLFRKAGDPIQLSHTRAEYRLAADGAHAAAFEIHSIDKVCVVREARGHTGVTEFGPLYAVRHEGAAAAAAAPGRFWVARRDETLARISPGHELKLALVDPEFSADEASSATISTDLTCSNRDLPLQLRIGQPAGDLLAESSSGAVPFGLLRKPTPSWRFGGGSGSDCAHWRLIAHLALNHGGLTTAGLPDLQKMLALYDLPRSPVARRQIAGIVGLEHGSVRAWLRTRPVSSLMPGVGIRMTVDEEAFAGSSLYVFAQVMDRYFSLNSQLNCFTRLEIVSHQSGEEMFACPPRSVEKLRP
ncbi:type VI secretion system baseplate subunit TssF [Massilia litorea]|uniref:Type VI secretion system baseplate subunit TssF n=1 Tax=Massilia litorea TaxID=2769491 RepID=A0A7L9U4K4_9BURK|nr:type VI secretion system baseplate subunit TssF [Massilia litorea]QOL49222.1 type VI secretion system baseplate subunit TssF [Massilia litorea]